MNAFLDETRTERLDIGLSFLRQLRLSPTLETLLAEEKPANQSWGDFFLTSAVNQALASRNIRGDWRGSNRLIVRLIGGLSVEPDVRQQGSRSRSFPRQISEDSIGPDGNGRHQTTGKTR